MDHSSAIFSALLRVVHPDLFFMALNAMEEMARDPNLHDVVSVWNNVFNGASLISNRESPIHRDCNSKEHWYDLLATLGPYEDGVMEIPGAGVRLAYNSGTIVALAGRVLRHGVGAVKKDRVCFAYYMRENVHKRMGSMFASWSKEDRYM